MWTKKPPQKRGYYWWRKNRFKDNSIYYVFEDGETWYCRWCHSGLYDRKKLSEVGGEWEGPLKAPNIDENGDYTCNPCIEDQEESDAFLRKMRESNDQKTEGSHLPV